MFVLQQICLLQKHDSPAQKLRVEWYAYLLMKLDYEDSMQVTVSLPTVWQWSGGDLLVCFVQSPLNVRYLFSHKGGFPHCERLFSATRHASFYVDPRKNKMQNLILIAQCPKIVYHRTITVSDRFFFWKALTLEWHTKTTRHSCKGIWQKMIPIQQCSSTSWYHFCLHKTHLPS